MVRRVLLVTALTALVVALSACKDDLVLPPPAGDPGTDQPIPGGGGGGGNGDAATALPDAGGVDGGLCTDLASTGSITDEEAVADTAPTGTGTTIAEGTYNLIRSEIFVGGAQAGPTGNTYRSTLRISAGTTFERVVIFAAQGATPTTTRSRGIITTVGTSATISLSCPTSTQEQLSFSATSTQLVLTDLFTKRQSTYTRAP